ncbi:Bax inhibitor-1/YccA family protein [Aurantimonas sp. VKM B-3413]|uniref:Bax inhibitor-1/YccA family protein n=1 Tax=Aurantimonas sp. VKM B-3413 TaxID=2779401 RepID=UPI001E3611B8|nr:Bax inhibitor-1/YccA family protein [Aurantimonas sp. VKM B-3413]MCB8839182.1 Bax inhibitor-1/YccA family protein [Aurantimonas sp. VKM B-3413]
MADFRNASVRSVPSAGTRADIDQGLRSYMIKVYNLMAGGLVLTGIAAYALYSFSVVTNGAGDIIGLTALGETVFQSPLRWVLMLAPLAMVFFLSFRVNKMSVAAAQATFWAYAAMVGLSLSTIFLVYTQESITQVFFITAASFGALSLFGYTTKRDLSGMGSFLFMGVIGIVIAMIVNIFLASPALTFAISCIGVLVFAGLTAYDTQQIKEMYYEGDGSAVMGRKAVMGALRLYLDFLNMFLFLLQLFGNRN